MFISETTLIIYLEYVLNFLRRRKPEKKKKPLSYLWNLTIKINQPVLDIMTYNTFIQTLLKRLTVR